MTAEEVREPPRLLEPPGPPGPVDDSLERLDEVPGIVTVMAGKEELPSSPRPVGAELFGVTPELKEPPWPPGPPGPVDDSLVRLDEAPGTVTVTAGKEELPPLPLPFGVELVGVTPKLKEPPWPPGSPGTVDDSPGRLDEPGAVTVMVGKEE